MSETALKQPLNPSSLSLRDAAMLLSKVGGKRVSEELIQADIDIGAPCNGNGTVNLVHYAAWLVKEMSRSATT